MAIRWTEKQLQEYYKRTGKGPAKAKNKPRPPQKQKTPTVTPITGGILVTLWRVHPSLNQWTKLHPMKQAEIKKDWEEELFYLLAAYRHYKLAHAKVDITYYIAGVVPDKDNYTPKFIMDGLVKSGLLANDTRDIVNPQWDFGKAARADQRTEIKITWEV